MNKQKWFGIIAGSLLMTGAGLYMMNAVYGNPISKNIATNAAEEYIIQNYPNQELHIDQVIHDSKLNEYTVSVVSATSIDTHFSVEVSMSGKIYRDTYEDVESNRNTYYRLDDEYRKLVDSMFESAEFPIESEVEFGVLRTVQEDIQNEVQYGIDLSTLEKDKQYDIRDIAKSAGLIVFTVKDKEVSYQKASELLLQLKKELEKANVPFYAIDFELEESSGEINYTRVDSQRIEIADFLGSDIYEEGLEARVKEAHENLTKYYQNRNSLSGE